jgi:hypothetical protein
MEGSKEKKGLWKRPAGYYYGGVSLKRFAKVMGGEGRHRAKRLGPKVIRVRRVVIDDC